MATTRLSAMCEHMLALVEYCKAHQVEFGGCGECGSAWLDCKICGRQVDEAHRVFWSAEERDASPTFEETEDEEEELIR